MKKPTDKPIGERRKAGKVDNAFDLWLKDGLHKLFDDIAKQPLPQSLVDLIEQDRKK